MRILEVVEYLKDNLNLETKSTPIYYWEEKELLGKIYRNKNKRRSYTKEDIERIALILMLSKIAVPLKTIKKVIVEGNQKSKEFVIEELLALKNTIIPALQGYLTNR